MHNVDRTQFEFSGEQEEFLSGESFEFGENEEVAPAFAEHEEMELAAELLETTSNEELNHFLGKLLRRAASGVGKIMKSPIGQALGGVLKRVAKTALPMAGAALGNLVLPGVGGMIGGKLASAAGSMFGLELEGLSNEDREFEVARRFVRFAGAAARKAAVAPAALAPLDVAQRAISAAARTLAPGLADAGQALATAAGNVPAAVAGALQGADPSASAGVPGSYRSGRWVRRGNRIIVYGV